MPIRNTDDQATTDTQSNFVRGILLQTSSGSSVLDEVENLDLVVLPNILSYRQKDHTNLVSTSVALQDYLPFFNPHQ